MIEPLCRTTARLHKYSLSTKMDSTLSIYSSILLLSINSAVIESIIISNIFITDTDLRSFVTHSLIFSNVWIFNYPSDRWILVVWTVIHPRSRQLIPTYHKAPFLYQSSSFWTLTIWFIQVLIQSRATKITVLFTLISNSICHYSVLSWITIT